MTDGFWKSLQAFFKFIFVPSDEYFSKKFDDIKTKLSLRFNIDVDQLNQLNLEPEEPKNVGNFVGGVYVDFINLEFVKDNINLIRNLIGSILYIFLFYFHYRMAIKLIRGTDMTNGGGK